MWPMLKKSATLIAFLPRHEVVDAYLARRQSLTDEKLNSDKWRVDPHEL